MTNIINRAANKIRTAVSTRLAGPILSPFRKGGIALFHIGRSGSTAMCDLLNQHPDIYWDREVYERTLPPWQAPVAEVPLRDLSLDPLAYLKKRTRRSGRKFYGCEIKFFHLELLGLEMPAFIDALGDLGFHHFMILERQNYLRAVVSSIILHQNKVIQIRAGEKGKKTTVHMDLDNVFIDRTSKPLMDYLLDYEAQFTALASILSEKGFLHLTYEADIEPSPLNGYEKVCGFLEIPKRKAVIQRGKVNPFPLSEIILNFDEVSEYLQGTQFHWMLKA